MKRVKMTVAYDGTNYCGWQYQPNGLTIEEILNKALWELLGERAAVIGASRTDSGVHALCNVAVFDTASRMPADRICFALNQRLPADIRIQSSEEVPTDWHPRKKNCVKTYEYRILNRKVPDPTLRLNTYFCYFDLDEEKMRRASACLVGEHDFCSFCSVRGQAAHTVRTIYGLEVVRDRRDVITIRISGSGFLYNMVRIIAGTLIKVGMGVYPPEHVEEILYARDRHAAGQTAPACGLTLMEIEYETTLRPVLLGENRDWSYRLLQTHVEECRTSWLAVQRCAERDFAGLVERVVHQAYRNGAERVYALDFEKGRFRGGQAYGIYRMADVARQAEAVLPLTDGEKGLLAGLADSAGGSPISGEWFLALERDREFR